MRALHIQRPLKVEPGALVAEPQHKPVPRRRGRLKDAHFLKPFEAGMRIGLLSKDSA
jgi:hypothetical protein